MKTERTKNSYLTKAYRVDGNHSAIVSPRSQLHTAVLLVKGEVGDYNFTVAFEDGWWSPRDMSSIVQKNFGELVDSKNSICTKKRGKNSCRNSIQF